MDNANFDAVARAVAAGASRRQVLRLLAIGAVTTDRGSIRDRVACVQRVCSYTGRRPASADEGAAWMKASPTFTKAATAGMGLLPMTLSA